MNNSLSTLHSSNSPADIAAGWRILEESIPADERRTLEQQLQTLLDPRYKFSTFLNKEGTALAVTGVWRFDRFVFLEHIAVVAAVRGTGLGSNILKDLCISVNLPVVVESELPTVGLIAARRIEWYKELNFVMNSFNYTQPPYSADKRAVPMMLLSYPQALLAREFEEVVRVLQTEVYKFYT